MPATPNGLGVYRSRMAPYIITEVDAEPVRSSRAIVNSEFAQRVAFAT